MPTYLADVQESPDDDDEQNRWSLCIKKRLRLTWTFRTHCGGNAAVAVWKTDTPRASYHYREFKNYFLGGRGSGPAAMAAAAAG